MRLILSKGILEIVPIILDSGNEAAISFVSKLSESDIKLVQNTGFELLSLCGFNSPNMLTAFSTHPDCQVLDWDDFNCSAIPLDVFLVVPEAKLNQWKPMLTLMIDQLINSLMNRPDRSYDERELPPLLIMLDEFPRLGKVPSLLNGLMTLRSRGVTFALFAQSVSALELNYGEKTANAIVENCAYKIILRVSEPKGQQYFSDLIGSTATLNMSSSTSRSASFSFPVGLSIGNNRSESYSMGRRPIVFPHALSTLTEVICITPFGTCQILKAPFCN